MTGTVFTGSLFCTGTRRAQKLYIPFRRIVLLSTNFAFGARAEWQKICFFLQGRGGFYQVAVLHGRAKGAKTLLPRNCLDYNRFCGWLPCEAAKNMSFPLEQERFLLSFCSKRARARTRSGTCPPTRDEASSFGQNK